MSVSYKLTLNPITSGMHWHQWQSIHNKFNMVFFFNHQGLLRISRSGLLPNAGADGLDLVDHVVNQAKVFRLI